MARGLMAHHVRGRWSNTQENVFAIAALACYLARAEATEPALVARLWTGSRLAAEQAFRGGDFAAPAPRVEEMYAPETFGRVAAERLVIEAAATSDSRSRKAGENR